MLRTIDLRGRELSAADLVTALPRPDLDVAVAAEAADGLCVGAAVGALVGAVIWRCMPNDLPPPRRLAASASEIPRDNPKVNMTASKDSAFIKFS